MKPYLSLLPLCFCLLLISFPAPSRAAGGQDPTACEIGLITVEKGDCTSDTTYTITIDFDYVNEGADMFDLWANGVFFGEYAYASLPLTIPNFPKSGGSHDWLKVCDGDIGNCCRIKEFATQECGGGGDCEIGGLVVEPHVCEDGYFYVDLDFQYANVGDEGFIVLGNGMNYGTFDYEDLYITLGPLEGDCVTAWEFVVKDAQFPECQAVFELGPVCCGEECLINELVVDIGDCTSDSTYSLTVNFNYQNVQGNSFDLWANGEFFGYYQYAQLPLTINHFPKSGGSHDWLKVCDNDNPDCCAIIEFASPECGGGNECELSNLTVDIGDCTSGSTYTITVDFDYQGVQGSHFDLWANGNPFGYYAYAQLPLTINNFPKSGGSHDWLKVCDNDNPGCCAIIEFPSPECGGGEDCHIIEFVAEVSECDSNDQFFVHIDFGIQNPGSDSFKVQGNGMVHGIFAYSDLPVTIGPLNGDCEKEWEFVVRDLEFPDCAADTGIGVICCGEPCVINEMAVDVGDCTSDSTYNLHVAYNYHPGQGDSVVVYANGQYFGIYPYGSPLFLANFPKSGNNHDWIKICDSQKPDCCKIKEFESPDCGGNMDCHLAELEWVKECDNDSVFYIQINFIPLNPGSDSFKIVGNGNNYGFFAYADLPVVLGPLAADCMTPYEFVIRDKELEDCEAVIELGEVCCDPEEEIQFLSFNWTLGECAPEGTYEVTVDFKVDHPQADLFSVWVDGGFRGTYAIAELPLILPGVAYKGPLAKNKLKVCAFAPGARGCHHQALSPPLCAGGPQPPAKIQAHQNAGQAFKDEDSGEVIRFRLHPGAPEVGIPWPSHASAPEWMGVYDLNGRTVYYGPCPSETGRVWTLPSGAPGSLHGVLIVRIGSRDHVATQKIIMLD